MEIAQTFPESGSEKDAKDRAWLNKLAILEILRNLNNSKGFQVQFYKYWPFPNNITEI